MTDVAADMQVQAWNSSLLKIEFLTLFPDFSAMKQFVEDRVRGEALRAKLTDTVNVAEDKYFSGTMNAEQAKRSLGALK